MTMDQIDRYRRRDKDTAVDSILNYNYEPSELGSMTSSEEAPVETLVYPSKGQTPNNGERNDLRTHPNATKPDEVSQELTFKFERLRLLMQETSDKNDKIKAELFKQADEIEAQISRMRARITSGQQKPPTLTKPDDAVTDSHHGLNESNGAEETPPEPWHHPRTISLPGSGRFTSRNIFPGTEVAGVKPKKHIKFTNTPECQYQCKEGYIVRVVSIPMCMSELMTNECGGTI
jgi:hypothetical protein